MRAGAVIRSNTVSAYAKTCNYPHINASGFIHNQELKDLYYIYLKGCDMKYNFQVINIFKIQKKSM